MSTASFIASQKDQPRHIVRAGGTGRWGAVLDISTPNSTTPCRRRGGAGPRSTPRSGWAPTPPAGPTSRRGHSRTGAPKAGGCQRNQIHARRRPGVPGTVEDLFSRRLLGFALSNRHPTAALTKPQSIWPLPPGTAMWPEMVLHTGNLTQYTSRKSLHRGLCKTGVRQSTGRANSSWTTPRPNRSSQLYNTNASHGTATPPEPRPAPSAQFANFVFVGTSTT